MKHLILAALLSGAVIAPAAAQDATIVEKSVIKEEKVVEGADSEEARLVADCSARKFETSAEFDKDGTKRVTKLKLCSVVGADDMAWIKTLEGAKARVAGIPDLSPESRTKIEAELDAEIARLHKGMGH
ncbi:MAG: hypothetical protein ABIP07_00600 [Sphingomicrobium sp.]